MIYPFRTENVTGMDNEYSIHPTIQQSICVSIVCHNSVYSDVIDLSVVCVIQC